MQKVIQHQDETIYELVCSSEDLAFWSSWGFKPVLYDKEKDSYSLKKVCPYKIHGKVSSLSMITKGSKEGLADRWGNIILACKYERIELYSSHETHGIQVIHFMAYTAQKVEIFRYIGGNPKRVLTLERLK